MALDVHFVSLYAVIRPFRCRPGTSASQFRQQFSQNRCRKLSASESHVVALVCSPGQVIASFTSADAARGGIGMSKSSAERYGRRTRGGPPRPKQAAVISASAMCVQYHAASSADDYQFNRTPGYTNARKTRMLFARGYIISPLRGCCRFTKTLSPVHC